MSTLAERLTALMEERGTNQFALANQAGVGPDYIRDILRGKVREPSATKLARVAAALGVPFSELVALPDESETVLTPLAQRIRERLKTLGKTARGASLAAGLSPEAVRMILSGRSKSPQAENLHALAKVLGVTPEWLLFGDSSVPLRLPPSEVQQPASRPGGSDETGRQPTFRNERKVQAPDFPALTVANGQVTLNLTATVSVGTAAKILALIEEDRG